MSKMELSTVFDLNELAILISSIEPTKRYIVGVTARLYVSQQLCSSKVG